MRFSLVLVLFLTACSSNATSTLKSVDQGGMLTKSEKPEPQEKLEPEAGDSSGLTKIYGNWCGPAHPVDISKGLPPVDELDRACMTHDICYEQSGYFDCECDKALNEELNLLASERAFHGAQILFVRSFRTYFKGSPCAGDHSGKIAPSRAAHNIIKKIGDKTQRLYNRLPFVGDAAEN